MTSTQSLFGQSVPWVFQVCTEHILLGLVTEATGKGGARQADRSCLAAVKLEAARAEARLLSSLG